VVRVFGVFAQCAPEKPCSKGSFRRRPHFFGNLSSWGTRVQIGGAEKIRQIAKVMLAAICPDVFCLCHRISLSFFCRAGKTALAIL
jgi:hypothetical protein